MKSAKMAPRPMTIVPMTGLRAVAPDDDLAELLVDAARASGVEWQPGDVLVAASKVVSKSEGCFVRLTDLVPSARAVDLAGACRPS
jgi:coenzyme F420-0:L-glutamate ligase/coenzyme F420-1:gamma-L-glutamate ligase